MSLRVTFRRAARAEFEKDADYYEQQRVGLGREFMREIDETVQRAVSHPERFAVVAGGVQRIAARRFPYTVFYRVRGAKIEVLAVFHGSRNPLIWQRRI